MAATAPAHRSLERARFALAGRVLSISAEDEAICHILDTTYDDARAADGRAAHHHASIRRLSDGRLHARFDRKAIGVGEVAATAPLLSAYYAAKEIFARFAAAAPRSVAFYGAAVTVNGAVVLILGPTSIGKTLFALHLAWQGATFLGDETVVLDLRSGTASALAKKPSLREGALEFLPADELRERIACGDHALQTDRGKFWYALTPQQLAGIAPVDRAYPLGGVCLLRERSDAFSMRRVDGGELLPGLMQRAYRRPSQLAQISGLRRALRGVPQYEVTLGHPQHSARQFLAEHAACG